MDISDLNTELVETAAATLSRDLQWLDAATIASSDALRHRLLSLQAAPLTNMQLDSVLVMSVLQGSLHNVQLLLELGAVPDRLAVRRSVSCCGYTCVHAAAATGAEAILSVLLPACGDAARLLYDGPEITPAIRTRRAADVHEGPSLHGSVSRASADVVLGVSSAPRLTAVVCALLHGQDGCLAALAESGGLVPNAELWPGSGPPLVVATTLGLPRFAAALAGRGADPNMYLPDSGHTPVLLAAALEPSGETLKALLAAGGDPLARCLQRLDAFHYAALCGDPEGEDGPLRMLLAQPGAARMRVPRLVSTGNDKTMEPPRPPPGAAGGARGGLRETPTSGPSGARKPAAAGATGEETDGVARTGAVSMQAMLSSAPTAAGAGNCIAVAASHAPVSRAALLLCPCLVRAIRRGMRTPACLPIPLRIAAEKPRMASARGPASAAAAHDEAVAAVESVFAAAGRLSETRPTPRSAEVAAADSAHTPAVPALLASPSATSRTEPATRPSSAPTGVTASARGRQRAAAATVAPESRRAIFTSLPRPGSAPSALFDPVSALAALLTGPAPRRTPHAGSGSGSSMQRAHSRCRRRRTRVGSTPSRPKSATAFSAWSPPGRLFSVVQAARARHCALGSPGDSAAVNTASSAAVGAPTGRLLSHPDDAELYADDAAATDSEAEGAAANVQTRQGRRAGGGDVANASGAAGSAAAALQRSGVSCGALASAAPAPTGSRAVGTDVAAAEDARWSSATRLGYDWSVPPDQPGYQPLMPPPHARSHLFDAPIAAQLEHGHRGVTYLHALAVPNAGRRLRLLLATALPPYFAEEDTEQLRPLRSIDRPSTAGATALTDGALAGADAACAALLECGHADPNVSHEALPRPRPERRSVPLGVVCPLNSAVLQGSAATVQGLLEHGADPCINDTTGLLPLLHHALLCYGQERCRDAADAARARDEAALKAAFVAAGAGTAAVRTAAQAEADRELRRERNVINGGYSSAESEGISGGVVSEHNRVPSAPSCLSFLTTPLAGRPGSAVQLGTRHRTASPVAAAGSHDAETASRSKIGDTDVEGEPCRSPRSKSGDQHCTAAARADGRLQGDGAPWQGRFAALAARTAATAGQQAPIRDTRAAWGNDAIAEQVADTAIRTRPDTSGWVRGSMPAGRIHVAGVSRLAPPPHTTGETCAADGAPARLASRTTAGGSPRHELPTLTPRPATAVASAAAVARGYTPAAAAEHARMALLASFPLQRAPTASAKPQANSIQARTDRAAAAASPIVAWLLDRGARSGNTSTPDSAATAERLRWHSGAMGAGDSVAASGARQSGPGKSTLAASGVVAFPSALPLPFARNYNNAGFDTGRCDNVRPCGVGATPAAAGLNATGTSPLVRSPCRGIEPHSSAELLALPALSSAARALRGSARPAGSLPLSSPETAPVPRLRHIPAAENSSSCQINHFAEPEGRLPASERPLGSSQQQPRINPAAERAHVERVIQADRRLLNSRYDRLGELARCREASRIKTLPTGENQPCTAGYARILDLLLDALEARPFDLSPQAVAAAFPQRSPPDVVAAFYSSTPARSQALLGLPEPGPRSYDAYDRVGAEIGDVTGRRLLVRSTEESPPHSRFKPKTSKDGLSSPSLKAGGAAAAAVTRAAILRRPSGYLTLARLPAGAELNGEGESGTPSRGSAGASPVLAATGSTHAEVTGRDILDAAPQLNPCFLKRRVQRRELQNLAAFVVNSRDRVVRWAAVHVAMRVLPDGDPVGARIITLTLSDVLKFPPPIPPGPLDEAGFGVRQASPGYARGGVHGLTALQLCEAFNKPLFSRLILMKLRRSNGQTGRDLLDTADVAPQKSTRHANL